MHSRQEMTPIAESSFKNFKVTIQNLYCPDVLDYNFKLLWEK